MITFKEIKYVAFDYNDFFEKHKLVQLIIAIDDGQIIKANEAAIHFLI